MGDQELETVLSDDGEEILGNEEEAILGDGEEAILGNEEEGILGEEEEEILGDEEEQVLGDEETVLEDEEEGVLENEETVMDDDEEAGLGGEEETRLDCEEEVGLDGDEEAELHGDHEETGLDGEEEGVLEGEEEYQEEQDTELLQQFHAQDEHGNTIVLTAEQMQRYQEQMTQQLEAGGDEHDGMIMQSEEDAETQEIVNEILDNEHELETQGILDDGSTHVTNAELQDLITLHTVDAEGNIIDTGHSEEEGDGTEHMDLEHVDEEIQIGHDEVNIDGSMMETENIEEVITSSTHEDDSFGLSNSNFGEANNSDLTHQFLSVRDSVFNSVTGTLQPISTVLANKTQPIAPAKPRKTKQQQVKYVIANSSGVGNSQQLFLDAQQLQGLLQGGGNTITLSSASGKQSILLASPQKSKVAKSPAKILPAPIPAGDQQQGSPQRILLRQGNVLTPVSLSGSSPKFIQVTGSGNQVQYIRVVQNNKQQILPFNKIPIAPSMKPKITQKSPSGQTVLSLSAGTDLSSFQNSGLGNLLMLPNYMVKTEPGTSAPVSIRPSIDPAQAAAEQAMFTLQQNLAQQQAGFESFRSLLEPNGMRPRKPCNCTKSQCLKLYCDCFANGEFCHLCNCTNCYNNLTHEEDRQKAIKLVLERNPGAFRPKIGKSSQTGEAHERRHNKGCNCRRSGCLKNYCECYEAKIFCSGICKCSGCKNCIENIPSGLPNGVGVEQHFAGAGTSHRQTLKDLAEAAEVRVQQQNQVKNKMKAQWQDVSTQNNIGVTVPACIFRYPQGSISYEVVTSTVDLLLAKAEAGEKQRLGEGELERVLIEEFGDCLSALMELGTTPGQD